MPWYLAALGAAVVWGLHYPLLDQALKKISIVSALSLTAIPVVLLALFSYRQIAADFEIVRTLPVSEQLTIASIMLTSIVASSLLFASIGSKNATLASLIEITYPVFVALFAFLLFKTVHLNWSVVAGGALIFAGVFIIILNNR